MRRTMRLYSVVGLGVLAASAWTCGPGQSGGDGNGGTTPPTSRNPRADAGQDQTVLDLLNDAAQDVTLNGTGSGGIDAPIAQYVWAEGGSQIATGATPTVSLSLGTHTITLTVTDENGSGDSDEVVVSVVTPNALAAADYGDPTAYEQAMLEMINRARWDPPAEAKRLELASADEAAIGSISTAPAPALAMNGQLLAIARSHVQSLIDNDSFSHIDAAGDDQLDRIGRTGTLRFASENVARLEGVDLNVTVPAIHDILFKDEDVMGRLDRKNILDHSAKEIGIGIATGVVSFDLIEQNATLIVQDFAAYAPAETVLVTGVVYTDANGNGIYDAGEGRGDVPVSLSNDELGAAALRTATHGGYAFRVFMPAVHTIVFDNDPAFSIRVDVRDKNIKVDLRGLRIDWFDVNQ